jgi:hypothetical protein
MSCDCAQGYNQPAVNKSPCGCQAGYSGPRPYGIGWLAPPVITRRPGLGRPYGMAYSLGGPPGPALMMSGPRRPGLLGYIPQGMAPVTPGDAFEFGFNAGVLRDPTQFAEDLAGIIEGSGLSYDTSSGMASGFALNPFYTISGRSVFAYDSGNELCDAIVSTLTANGWTVQQNDSLNCRTFSTDASGAQTVSGTPYSTPGKPPPGAPPPGNPPPGQCDWNSMSFGQWLSCEFGFSSGITAGFSGALVIGAVVVIALAVRK